jgi:phage anti-repressor protein
MELQVLISKKGTKVVTATNLYYVLQLPDQHYGTNVKKWFREVYEFSDGIRRPEKMKDFADRPRKDNPVLKDYYISVELAKLITLQSRSKHKFKYAKWLQSLEGKTEKPDLLTKDQVLAMMRIAKAMGMVSCQESSERQHMKVYEERNGGKANNWWQYRADVMGYSSQNLRDKLKQSGKGSKGKSQRNMLMQLDKYEMVRTGVIDLFMAMGKSEAYAQNLGDLAKVFAKELQVEIFDDRDTIPALTPSIDPSVINEVKELQKGEVLSVW